MAVDTAMAAAVAVEMQKSDECVAGADDANDKTERWEIGTETEESSEYFLRRNASASDEAQQFHEAIGRKRLASLMKLVISGVIARFAAKVRLRQFVHNLLRYETSMDSDFRTFCCSRCIDSNFFLFGEGERRRQLISISAFSRFLSCSFLP